jgi:hypothetical protein
MNKERLNRHGIRPTGNGGNTLSGNPTRVVEESLKNCIDAINNNGPVLPMTPCNRTNTTYTPTYPE